MDYYASYSRGTVPKWVWAMLGGVFTLIIIVCAGMIVHLLRPANATAPAIVAAASVAPVQPAAVVTAPAAAPAPAAQTAPVAAPAAVATTAPVAQPALVASRKSTKHVAHSHKHAILAKHEGKASRTSKSDIDRILGL